MAHLQKNWRDKTVAYLQKNLAFEHDKSIGAATANLHQQNPCMTSGIIFVATRYCTIYYLLYQEFLTEYV